MSGGGVGGTPSPSPVRGRRGGGGAGPAGLCRPRPGKFRGVFGVLYPPTAAAAHPPPAAEGTVLAGRGHLGMRPQVPPPPVPYPLSPPSVTPFGRGGGGCICRTTFWEGVEGGSGGAGKPSECPPPPPPKLPAGGAPGRPPEQGTRGRGEGCLGCTLAPRHMPGPAAS